jgi:hypothetical protein
MAVLNTGGVLAPNGILFVLSFGKILELNTTTNHSLLD